MDCVIQARMGSSRLPGKVMSKVNNENTVFDYLINQLRYSKHIKKIIVFVLFFILSALIFFVGRSMMY